MRKVNECVHLRSGQCFSTQKIPNTYQILQLLFFSSGFCFIKDGKPIIIWQFFTFLVKKTISITSLIAFLTRRHNSTRKCQQLASAHGISGDFDHGDLVDVVDIVDNVVGNVDVVDDDVVNNVNSWQAHLEYQVILMMVMQSTFEASK